MTTAPTKRAFTRPAVTTPRFADKYLLALCLILLGYALDGRGFAYLFLGEVAMIVGVVIVVNCRGWTNVFHVPQLLLLLPFWAWGAARTIPYLKTYRIDAVRDAMLWGYSIFAFIVAGLIVAEPVRLINLLRRYGHFARLFLALIPIVVVGFRFGYDFIPHWPLIDVPVIHEKEGDIMVHLAGIFAFWIAGLDRKVNPIWLVLLAANVAAMGVIDRAGELAFVSVFALCALCRPLHPIVWRSLAAVVLVIFVLWATNVHVPASKGREISFRQIVTNIRSVYSDTGSAGLDETKEWRVNWWHDIERYTLHGPYYWTGKGFGINLAVDDGFQVFRDNSLRAPHSAHFDILAREGVTGLALWIALQLSWALGMFSSYVTATMHRDARWQAVFLFLMAYWLAFIINSSFDVYFEGPMGAIWFWTVFGVGAAVMWLHKTRPEVIYVA